MTTSTAPLPSILFRPPQQRLAAEVDHLQLSQLRKVATHWLGKPGSKLPREALVKALRKALEDDQLAAVVMQTLGSEDRAVLAAYRRQGGTVNGAVIRIDLLARGLLEKVVTTRFGSSWSRWKRNPIEKLAEKWLLISPHQSRYGYHSFGGYGQETERPFLTCGLPASVARQVQPAGPPPWRIPPAAGTPVALARRSSAEVALDLAQLFSYVAARGQIKFKKSGGVATPTLRTLARDLPLGQDADFPLPDPHGLYLELLIQAGVIRVEGALAHADPAAAAKLFTRATAWQAHQWARGWLLAQDWRDGLGAGGLGDSYAESGWESPQCTLRQVLAWALACLAQVPARGEEQPWFDLTVFITELHALHGDINTYSFPWEGYAWNPSLAPARGKEKKKGTQRQEAYWFAREGTWCANALMVTLVYLGLVERGRSGSGADPRWCFRLTPLGRIVFGAPEITPPPEEPDRRFLVLQPNFDVVAYLDQADAASAGTLGQLAESPAARSGLVQTFRLTRNSLYQALESGLSPAQIVDFFRQHNQGELPANVVRSIADWSAQRESLVLHSGVTLLGFPSPAARDTYLASNPGSACGERFVLVPGKSPAKVKLENAVVADHQGPGRRTLTVDEYGRIRTDAPSDLLQVARLRRLARPAPPGWEITADSVRQAAASGLKAGLLEHWLHDHLREPMPPLLAQAIHAWLGQAAPLEMAEAVLLHIPDEQQFEAIISSSRLRPFLQGCPGPGWLIVRPEARKPLAAVLGELGFTVGRELTHKPLPDQAPVVEEINLI